MVLPEIAEPFWSAVLYLCRIFAFETNIMFWFKQFSIDDSACGMKLSSDSVLLGAWFLPMVAKARAVVDAGAGAGILALMAAQVCRNADITAVEIEHEAAEACKANVAASPWTSAVTVVEGDFRKVALPKADAVISNPPYFSNGVAAPDSNRALARHQQQMSFSELMARCNDVLTDSGLLGLVAPAQDEQSLVSAAASSALDMQCICRVTTASGKPPKRILCVFGRGGSGVKEEELRIGSERYRALVSPFYLRIH